MKNTQHTPTPCAFAFPKPQPLTAAILARTLEASGIENAEAIATAYFAHDELVAALDFLLGELDGLEGTIGTFKAEWAQVARDQARAALARNR